MISEKNKHPGSWVRPLAEYGPIVVFFAVYWLYGIFPATASIMAATCVAIPLSYFVERRIPILSLITAVIVGVFGGLTLWLQDETFIKMKPTIIQVLFGVVLLVGDLFGKNFLRLLMGKALEMKETGWKILTRRFAYFFFLMAVLNELIWRTQTTDIWVNFKVFGILILTAVFFVCQAPLIKKYSIEPNRNEE